MPIALAVLLTFLLAPLASRLERLHVPRVVAVALLVGTFALGVVGLGWLLERQVVDVATNVSNYKQEIVAKVESLLPQERKAITKAGTALAEIGREIAKPDASDGDTSAQSPTGPPGAHPAAPAKAPAEPMPVRVVEAPASPLTAAGGILGPVLGRLATVLVVLVFTVFMLMNREDLRNRFIRLVGQREMHTITPALDDAGARISRYLLMQSITNSAVGLIAGLILWGLGVPSAALWGLLAALLRFVPYVGTWMAALLPASVMFATTPGWREPLLIVGLIGAVELIVGQLIEPLVFRNGTGLSPVAILASSVFWAWLWGPVGLLLAMPLTVCVVVIGRHVPRLEFLEIMLGDEPVLPPGARVYQRLLAGDPEEATKVAAEASKDKLLAELYDAVLLPALRLSEIDRHRGDVEDGREQSVRDMLQAIVEDLETRDAARAPQPSAAPVPTGADPGPAQGSVLCVPVRDEADELAARMLAGVLTGQNTPVHTLSGVSLISELIEDVAAHRPAALCISAVPPQASLHIRVLCKRLRARFPTLPIVVALWDAGADEQAARSRLGEVSADYVVTTVAAAAERLGSLVRIGVQDGDAPPPPRPVSSTTPLSSVGKSPLRR
jgi:predicted PurR-regulated permease PerM